ncbi:uncharacterized protein LOC143602515 [Bidens hawaiensis]|uniref:uncharacterized protein LOC143602515 n=1 Tax=Bidens hawaiensis TaxID=980011 RepID=UPI00404B6872
MGRVGANNKPNHNQQPEVTLHQSTLTPPLFQANEPQLESFVEVSQPPQQQHQQEGSGQPQVYIQPQIYVQPQVSYAQPPPQPVSQNPTYYPQDIQPQQPPVVCPPQPVYQPEWSTGLFDCMDDPENAIITLCCPCVTFGQIAERIDNGRTSCESAGCIYTGIALCIAMPCIYSCTYRTKLRNHYGLYETPASDCITHLCCENCALCQDYRELNYSLGNTLESKKTMVKFQFQNFTLLKNETVEEMINRFCHLMAEMSTVKLEPTEADEIDTLKNALPPTYSTFLLVFKENGYFHNDNLIAEEFIYKLKEREYDMKCQTSMKDSHNPTLYGGSLLANTFGGLVPITAFYSQSSIDGTQGCNSGPNVSFL